MTITLTHSFTSAISDGGDTTVVRPVDWNDEHVIEQATDKLLGRDTAGDGATEEIGLGASLEFDGAGNIQRAALTGDVTAAANSNTTAIANNAVTDADLRDSAALSVIGRSANSTGDPADIVAANDGEVLRRSGTTVGFGTIATAGIGDDQVTYAKMQNVSATDKLLGRSTSGAGDVEEIACTAAGRALLDDAANSDQRTTLGLGSIAILAETTTAEYLANTADKALSTDQVNAAGALFGLTDGATINWDMASGFNASVTLAGNRTLANPTNTIVGRTGAIVVTQDGTGTRTLAYGTSWEAAGGVFPVLSTAAGSKDVLFYWIQSSTSVIITGILKALA